MEFVCFGEIMGCLNPEGYGRIAQAHALAIRYGGGEASVAASLASFGKQALYVTKVPDNELAKAAIQSLADHNVDISRVLYGGDRLGLYFAEQEATQKTPKVFYDRKYSSISMAEKQEFDWREIFANAEWFHFTGVMPALSDSCAEICLEACRVAKELGVTVSCDIHYDENLWSHEKAGQVMAALMPYVDVLIANEEDCERVFDLAVEDGDTASGALSVEGYQLVAKKLSERFQIPTVALTLREGFSVGANVWSAMLYNHGEYFFSKKYELPVVDRACGGDSFGGGLIYALSEGQSNQYVIDFAVASSALKHSVIDGFKAVTVAEIETLMGEDGSEKTER